MINDGNADIADVLQRIRAKLRAGLETGFRSDDSSSQSEQTPLKTTAALQGLLASAQMAQRQVAVVNPRRPGLMNNLIQAFKKLLRRIFTWYTRSLVEFHLSILRFLDETTAILDHDQSRIADLEKKVQALAQEIAELQQKSRSSLD